MTTYYMQKRITRCVCGQAEHQSEQLFIDSVLHGDCEAVNQFGPVEANSWVGAKRKFWLASNKSDDLALTPTQELMFAARG